MAAPFTIPKSAYEGFEALIKIGAEKLARLADDIQNKRLTLDSEHLAADLARATEAPAEELERAIDNILIPLSGLRSDYRMSAPEFVDLLTQLINEQNNEWYEANRDAWKRVSPSLVSLIGPDSYFAQLNKAYRLLVNRPALVDSIQILTELRPVYDDEITKIKAYLIMSTLAIGYQEYGEQKRIHLTVDKQDLERLQEQVERELRKIQLLEKQVALLEVASLVAGDGRS